ncbi:MAG: twin-arginine translocase subunit TatC [Paludibacteraceae bacterium]|nr:twin-arginine translocase subunit TatC [Paludibacteraceae bacterium]
MTDQAKSFWDHLDELRTCLIRIIIVVLMGAIVAFAMKTEVFSIVLAPTKSEFITYRWFSQFGDIADFNLNLINTQLTSQFSVHMQVSIIIGIICVSPYILYSIFAFVSPALYENERKYARLLVVAGYIMFMIGVALCYFLIFPLTIRFLGNYQVSDDVANIITLSSYIDTLTMLTLMLGIVFELPILCMLLGKMGILTADFMKEYRRHAIVIILIVAAIITPTTDVMTLMLVTLPIYLLYEISILAVKMINK